MPPESNRNLFVPQMFGANVVQEKHDASFLLRFRLAPFGILPIWPARRGHEDRFLLVPTGFEKPFRRHWKPASFLSIPALKVHVEEVFDGSMDSGSQRGGHASLARKPLAA